MKTLAIDPITLVGETYQDVTVDVTRYLDGATAVLLNAGGEPLANLSVNIEDTPRSGACIWAKDYSENRGLVDQLAQQGLIRRTGRTTDRGFVTLVEVELLGALIPETTPQQAEGASK